MSTWLDPKWVIECEPRFGYGLNMVAMRREHYDALAARLAEVAAVAHDGGLRGMSEADALISIRRLTLPHWNKAGSEIDRRERVTNSASGVPE